MENFSVNISIPADDDGFVLLRCPKCGEHFKLPPADIKSDEVGDIYCPLCGLVSSNYFTEDVIKLAEAKAVNQILDSFYSEMKKMERKTRNSVIQMKASKPKHEEEIDIKAGIESMDIINFDCCNRKAKIRHLLDYCGCYCPYCGGYQDGSK